jgi:hypothetical protein
LVRHPSAATGRFVVKQKIGTNYRHFGRAFQSLSAVMRVACRAASLAEGSAKHVLGLVAASEFLAVASEGNVAVETRTNTFGSQPIC